MNLAPPFLEVELQVQRLLEGDGGASDDSEIYLRFFAQAMGLYTGALKKMLEFADGASLARLHSGLAECRDMLILLEELKARIDEALRG